MSKLRMSIPEFLAWLERVGREEREKRARAKVGDRYAMARHEEFYVQLDLAPVSEEAAVETAKLLGSIRLAWRREAAR